MSPIFSSANPFKYENRAVCLLAATAVVMQIWVLPSTAGGETAQQPITWRLLSDNAMQSRWDGRTVPRLQTGAVYATDPAPDNPRDTEDRPRLQDGGGRYNDLNNLIGWSRRDAEIIFDLQDIYQIGAVELRLRSRVAESIRLSWRTEVTAEWRIGELSYPDSGGGGWHRITLGQPVEARQVRIELRGADRIHYLGEVRIWGLRTDDKIDYVITPRSAGDARLVLVDDGHPSSAILIAQNSSSNVVNAAYALQDNLEKMTGALIPLMTDEAELDKLPEGAVVIAVGAAAAEAYGLVIEQDYTGGCSYRIAALPNTRPDRPILVLAGNDSGELRGTNYAVYDFLQRLGCGWYGPDKLWQVIPEIQTVEISSATDISQRADFSIQRNIRIIGQLGDHSASQILQDAWRLEGRRIRAGHALGRTVLRRDRYEEEHPEWFAAKQVNLTHPGAIEQTAVELRQRLEESTAPRPVNLAIGQLDTGGYAVDERSREIGNISAQYLYFANRVARKLRETHPGEFIITFFSYWHTWEPPNPMKQAEPEVFVVRVNQGNKSKSWIDPEPEDFQRSHGSNVRQFSTFREWLETGINIGIYEWWIPGFGNHAWKEVPWYKGQAAIDNLRLWHQHGVRSLEYETMRRDEIGDGFPIRWPLLYVAARGMWDVSVTSEQVWREASIKLFENSSTPMLRYYQTLERAMRETPETAGNWNLPSPEKVYPQEVRLKASEYLQEALELANSGKVRERIEAELDIWNRGLEIIAEIEAESEAESFDIQVDDIVFEVDDSTVTAARIRALLGIPETVRLIAVEPDGQTREAGANEEYDLRTGIKFRTEQEF